MAGPIRAAGSAKDRSGSRLHVAPNERLRDTRPAVGYDEERQHHSRDILRRTSGSHRTTLPMAATRLEHALGGGEAVIFGNHVNPVGLIIEDTQIVGLAQRFPDSLFILSVKRFRTPVLCRFGSKAEAQGGWRNDYF